MIDIYTVAVFAFLTGFILGVLISVLAWRAYVLYRDRHLLYADLRNVRTQKGRTGEAIQQGDRTHRVRE